MHLRDTRFGGLFLAAKLLVLIICCCNAVTVNKRAPFCLLIKSDRVRTSQVSFLIHPPDISASPLLYWSSWTSDNRLQDCFMTKDATLVRRYLSLCREERVWDGEEKPTRFNLTALLRDSSLCEINSNISFALRKEDAKRRRKRAWVFPGTLWCGRGSSANDYEQLGMFVHADKCCREHDHCKHIIRSFTVNFGVFNPSLFTLSHCDCDHRFKQCLHNGNDTISNMVGYSFFNVLKLRCFEFIQKKKCAQYNWFGVCTEVKLSPVAFLKDSTPYNTTNLTITTSDTIDLSSNEVPVKHGGKQNNTKPKRIRLSKEDFSAQKTFQLKRKLASRLEKRKRQQSTGHGKGSKPARPNSFVNFTVAPQKKTSMKKKKITTQKLKVESLLHRTAKASVTPSTAAKISLRSGQKTTKHRPVSESGRKTLQNMKKRRKNKIQTSRKRRKEKQIQTQK